MILQGTAAAPGLAAGTMVWAELSGAGAAREAGKPAAELAFWRDAARRAGEEFRLLGERQRRENPAAADLFEAYAVLLEDLDLVEAVETAILAGTPADTAVEETGRTFAAEFAALDDDYMKARSADMLDITGRVRDILQGRKPFALPGEGAVILAARDLTPSQTVQLDRTRLLGFALAEGSANGHTAILAKSLGVPAVIGLGMTLKEHSGETALLDGEQGELTLTPDNAEQSRFADRQVQAAARSGALSALREAPDETADGRPVTLWANIASPEDLPAVHGVGARGIGLFRSEFLFLRPTPPTEEEQFAAYRAVVEGMAGAPVTIRTVDIGADKQAPWLELPAEPNPALGLRGIRLCLARPELFRTQLRAVCRASAFGSVRLLLPMITTAAEVREARTILREVQAELTAEGIAFDASMKLGVMVETPAAALIAEDLAQEADFFNLGTNDLTQYTLAVDRQGGAGLAALCDESNPALWALIVRTAQAAKAAGIPADVCGELGANPAFTRRLLELGLGLSVGCGAVLPLRERIRQITLS